MDHKNFFMGVKKNRPMENRQNKYKILMPFWEEELNCLCADIHKWMTLLSMTALLSSNPPFITENNKTWSVPLSIIILHSIPQYLCCIKGTTNMLWVCNLKRHATYFVRTSLMGHGHVMAIWYTCLHQKKHKPIARPSPLALLWQSHHYQNSSCLICCGYSWACVQR